MNPLLRRILALDAILFLMIIDQLCKWWVIEMYFRPRMFSVDGASADFFTWLVTIPQEQFPFVRFEVTSFFNMVMVWNHGVSFGMFAADSHAGVYFLIGMALILSSVFFFWMWKAKSLWQIIPCILVIAGALSNVWDRVRFGAVADFFDFHAFGIHYPAFNIADSCIVLGVILLIIDTLFIEPRRAKVTS
jgi:signal peptidase II